MARGREAAEQRILLNPGWGSSCSVAAGVAERRILSSCLLLINCNGGCRATVRRAPRGTLPAAGS